MTISHPTHSVTLILPDGREGKLEVAEDEFILIAAYREAGFILLCTAQPRSDRVIRTHQRVALRDYRLALGLPTPRA